MSATEIVSHYVRESPTAFRCTHCNVVKRRQNTMIYHVKTDHLHVVNFTCSHCEPARTFVQKCSYLQHLASVHPENPHPSATEQNPYATVSFKCPQCEYTASLKGNVVTHFARVHSNTWIPTYVRSEACTGCTKVHNSPGSYYYHAATCFVGRAPADQATILSRIR